MAPVSTPLLTTKLHIPPVRPGLVSRPRLIERLNAGLHRKLALGSGLDNDVYAIAIAGPDVYVGGLFAAAGGNANANCIARWGTVIRHVYLPLALRNQ